MDGEPERELMDEREREAFLRRFLDDEDIERIRDQEGIRAWLLDEPDRRTTTVRGGMRVGLSSDARLGAFWDALTREEMGES